MFYMKKLKIINIKKNVDGFCRKRPTKRFVVIDSDLQSYVDKYPFMEEKIFLPLIYHELGHCEFNLDHDNEMNENGTGKSWMNEDLKMSHIWGDFDYYRWEMKNRSGL